MTAGVRATGWDVPSGNARGWLARHGLPDDGATVALVAERLAARRRGRVLEKVVFLVMAVTGWWAISRDQGSWGEVFAGEVWIWVWVAAFIAGDVVRRYVVWGRWDRRLLAGLPVRVAALRRPSWDDLVGARALRGAAALLVLGLLFAAWTWERQGGAVAATAAVLVVAAAIHTGVLLELARRRPAPAGDETALAVNDRLRGEEAGHAVSTGLFWVAIAPAICGDSNLILTTAGLAGYLLVTLAVRHRYAYDQVDGRVVAR